MYTSFENHPVLVQARQFADLILKSEEIQRFRAAEEQVKKARPSKIILTPSSESKKNWSMPSIIRKPNMPASWKKNWNS